MTTTLPLITLETGTPGMLQQNLKKRNTNRPFSARGRHTKDDPKEKQPRLRLLSRSSAVALHPEGWAITCMYVGKITGERQQQDTQNKRRTSK
jgi:hypothetical protein